MLPTSEVAQRPIHSPIKYEILQKMPENVPHLNQLRSKQYDATDKT